MKPYYDHNGITIYHGDCLEIMPQLEPVDLIVTDPPWGVNCVRGYNERTKKPIFGDDKRPDISWMGQKKAIVWGGNLFAHQLPISSGWLVWYKYVQDYAPNSQCELAWTNVVKTIRFFQRQFTGFMCNSDGGKQHSAQKPISLMKWCLSFCEDGLVCDPYMGSGTTIVAAKAMNRQAIGIEIEEKYCEIAARRLAQEVLPFGSNHPVQPMPDGTG